MELCVSIAHENEMLVSFESLGRSREVDIDVRRVGRRVLLRTVAQAVPGPWSVAAVCKRRSAVAILTMGDALSVLLAVGFRIWRVPFVVTVHDAERHQGEGSAAAHASIRLACRLADRIVVPSAYVRDRLVARGFEPRTIDLVPLEPLLAREGSKRDSDRPRGQVPRILFLGRILPYKGLDLLLNAWPTVVACRPDATLVVAGEGGIAEDLGTDERHHGVIWKRRWLSDAEILDELRSADLMVLPYREASQSGIIGMAQAFRVPVVCTNVGALPSQARPLYGDLVVEPTSAAIAEGILSSLARLDENDPIAQDPGMDPETPWQRTAELIQTVVGRAAVRL